jgi:hypothetical protein
VEFVLSVLPFRHENALAKNQSVFFVVEEVDRLQRSVDQERIHR